ncbi:hypothetical protein VIBRN418_12417 [Vibrio sp. N418]|uniref:hypothetical protein n=1 Tax=Vibrio sp. (strain N418) TaxID=701176 RepID=UPI00021BDC34|nr:hypothetical protein [Vibrio sp. N418]EGU31022.1 hypothetical protein VIBRN418_12417 [Vibrio sp. N418]
MSSSIQFSRTKHQDHLFFDASEHGLNIGMTGGWSVGLRLECVREYMRVDLSENYSGSNSAGFYRDGDKVVLTHGDAKLLLSYTEAIDVLNFMNTNF